jgi:hypothetical protein
MLGHRDRTKECDVDGRGWCVTQKIRKTLYRGCAPTLGSGTEHDGVGFFVAQFLS